jgi:hypothetical protein
MMFALEGRQLENAAPVQRVLVLRHGNLFPKRRQNETPSIHQSVNDLITRRGGRRLGRILIFFFFFFIDNYFVFFFFLVFLFYVSDMN